MTDQQIKEMQAYRIRYEKLTRQEIDDSGTAYLYHDYIKAKQKEFKEESLAVHEKFTRPPGVTIGSFLSLEQFYGEDLPAFCTHEFVNVSFVHVKMVCKHCNVEQL